MPLGEHIHSFFLKKKRDEWHKFESTITEWEIKHYLANSLIALACSSTIELISLEADMSEKSALFMARTTRFHEFARSLTTTLGVEVSLATPDSPTAAHDFDLLILDSDGIRSDRIRSDCQVA